MKYPERHKIHAGCPGVQAGSQRGLPQYEWTARPVATDHRRPDDPHAQEGLVQQPRHRVRACRQDGAWRKKRS